MSSNPVVNREPQPWWRFGHVWLVIAGPVIVVIAGFVTLWLAISRPDPVMAEDYYRKGLEINQTLAQPEKVCSCTESPEPRGDLCRRSAPLSWHSACAIFCQD